MIASVIVYTYQRKDYIIRAVESLLHQSIGRKNFEIIVVKAFLDEEIDRALNGKADKVLFVDEKAHGKKLVAGIKACKGDYVFFMDDDDEFQEKKMETVIDRFSSHPRSIFVHNSIVRIDEGSRLIPGTMEAAPDKDLVLDTSKVNRRIMSSFYRYRANWYSSCMAFRREVLIEHLEQLDQVYQSVDPFLFLCALNHEGEMLLIPDRLTKYRVHTSTTNYKVDFVKYIESKELFYRRSAEIIEMSLKMVKDRSLEPYIMAYLKHNRYMSQILSLNTGRGNALKSILDYLPALNYIFVRYYLAWVAFGGFRVLAGRLSMRLYYWFTTRNA